MKKIIILVVILVVIGLGFYLFTDNTNNNIVDDQPETVSLFYYNPELDMDESGNILCSEEGLVSVEREIEGGDVIHETIALLIEGDLTEEEASEGIETEFPLENFSLVSSELEEGVLILTFDDPDFSSSGGSCRSSILLNQILSTANQFSEVEEVRIMPEEIFQP